MDLLKNLNASARPGHAQAAGTRGILREGEGWSSQHLMQAVRPVVVAGRSQFVNRLFKAEVAILVAELPLKKLAQVAAGQEARDEAAAQTLQDMALAP